MTIVFQRDSELITERSHRVLNSPTAAARHSELRGDDWLTFDEAVMTASE